MNQTYKPLSLWYRIFRRSGHLSFHYPTDATSAGHGEERLYNASEIVQPIGGKTILDVGCWTGELLELLAKSNARYLQGIDLEGPWLDVARSRVPKAKFVAITSLTAIPHEYDNKFDIVFLLETIEHIPCKSEVQALRAMHSLLAPGGSLVLSTPSAGLAALWDPAWFLVGHRHYRQRTLEGMLTIAGFDSVSWKYSGNSWDSFDTLLFYFYKHLLKKAYATPLLVKSKRRPGIYSKRRFDSTTIWAIAQLKT